MIDIGIPPKNSLETDLLNRIEELENINASNECNLTYADIKIGKLNARIAELERQVSDLEAQLLAGFYDGEGVV